MLARCAWPPPRIAGALLAAAVLAMTAAACDGGDKQGSSPSSGEREQTTGARTEDSGPQSPKESVRSYGTKADAAAETAIATAVKDFYAAKSAGDGAQVCTLLASATRKALVETLAGSGEGKGEACSSIVAPLLADQEPGYRDRIAGVQVTGVRVRGDSGLALIKVKATPEDVIPVRRENGSWKVAALAGSQVP